MDPSSGNCLLGLNDDGVVGGVGGEKTKVGGDFWLTGFGLGFVMGMAKQKNVMPMLPFCAVTVGGLQHFAKNWSYRVRYITLFGTKHKF